MPAISFQREFLDALLRGDKQQTTRKQTYRIKVGDTAQIYIEQRAEITGKPVRVMTGAGSTTIADRVNDVQYHYPAECPPSPFRDKFEPVYYAHILGKVEITGVDDIRPCEMRGEDLKAWAQADGFKDFHPTVIPPDRLYYGANMWFQQRYGGDWMERTWTVIRWNGWTGRYFEPKQ